MVLKNAKQKKGKKSLRLTVTQYSRNESVKTSFGMMRGNKIHLITSSHMWLCYFRAFHIQRFCDLFVSFTTVYCFHCVYSSKKKKQEKSELEKLTLVYVIVKCRWEITVSATKYSVFHDCHLFEATIQTMPWKERIFNGWHMFSCGEYKIGFVRHVKWSQQTCWRKRTAVRWFGRNEQQRRWMRKFKSVGVCVCFCTDGWQTTFENYLSSNSEILSVGFLQILIRI